MLSAQERKERPLVRGCLDYFPDALLEVAHVSFVGNEQHNPGQPMHWAREKSSDHADCIGRHLTERGTFDTDKLRHSAKMAWRSLALLQLEIEDERTRQISGGQGYNLNSGNTPVLHGGCTPDILSRAIGPSPAETGLWVDIFSEDGSGKQDPSGHHRVDSYDGAFRRFNGLGSRVDIEGSNYQPRVESGTGGQSARSGPLTWIPSAPTDWGI